MKLILVLNIVKTVILLSMSHFVDMQPHHYTYIMYIFQSLKLIDLERNSLVLVITTNLLLFDYFSCFNTLCEITI